MRKTKPTERSCAGEKVETFGHDAVETVLLARPVRVQCKECGVLTAAVPWSEPKGKFTLMFEAFAIHVIRACSSLEQARLLLGLNWKSVNEIMKRAVDRGLLERDL